MVSRTSILAGSMLAWAAALVVSGTPAQGVAVQKTTNDGIYTKVQADGAKAQFTRMCADCHPFTVAEKKKPKDVPLGDEPFAKAWDGRPLSEMITQIVMTMPNDGSGVVTDAEAVDLVAYVLQQNGYPAGSTPLTKEAAADIVLRTKK